MGKRDLMTSWLGAEKSTQKFWILLYTIAYEQNTVYVFSFKEGSWTLISKIIKSEYVNMKSIIRNSCTMVYEIDEASNKVWDITSVIKHIYCW